MKTASAKTQTFRVFELNVPNGTAHWKIEANVNGERKRYFFQTKAEAKKAAEDRNRQIVAHGASEAMSERDRRMALECIKMAGEYGKSLYDALHLARSIWAQEESSITVSDLCGRVVADYQSRMEQGGMSKGNLTMMQDTARRFSAQFGTRKISSLTGCEVKSWLEGCDLSNRTRTGYLKYSQTIMRWAIENNLLQEFKSAKSFDVTHHNGIKTLTIEQAAAFMNNVRPEFVPLFALNLFSGFRREEITKLDWSNIDLAQRLIILPARYSKNGVRTGKQKINEDIFENLVAWLTPYAKTSGPVAAFNKNEIQAEINRASKAAGFEWIKNSLRHSFASYASAAKGCEWTSKRCDHSEKVLREEYRTAMTEKDAQRYFEIKPAGAPASGARA